MKTSVMPCYAKKAGIRERFAGICILLFLSASLLGYFLENQYFVVFALLMLVGLGIDVVIVAFAWILKARRSKSWPRVRGKLVSADIVRRRYEGAYKKYFLSVKYEYVVNNNTYYGDCFNWVGVVSAKRENIEGVLNKLKMTQQLFVAYDPKRPSESVINPTVSWLYGIGIIVGFSIVVLALLSLKVLLKY